MEHGTKLPGHEQMYVKNLRRDKVKESRTCLIQTLSSSILRVLGQWGEEPSCFSVLAPGDDLTFWEVYLEISRGPPPWR